MKTLKIISTTLFFTYFLIQNLIAQPHIDSLKIIPDNPVNFDTVKIISYTFQTGAPCKLVDYNISIINNIISVYTNYPPGPLAVLCNSIDTVIIGILSAGCYEVHYFMTDTMVPVTYDVDTVPFCVLQSNSIQINNYSEKKISVYPNPFSETTFIFINKELFNLPVEIRIYDLFGSEVKRISKIKNKEVKFTRDNLASGQYIIKLFSENKMIDIKKIIIE